MTRYGLYCLGGLSCASKGIHVAYVVLIIDPEREFVFGDFGASFLPEWTLPEGQDAACLIHISIPRN